MGASNVVRQILGIRVRVNLLPLAIAWRIGRSERSCVSPFFETFSNKSALSSEKAQVIVRNR